jgi:predicted  nucleic acid-binding Zn-ribbon protein
LSEGIQAQYQILAEIKRVDEKVARLHAEAEHIPIELGKLEAELKARHDELDKIKSQFELSEKNLRKYETDLRVKEDNLRKAEGKMMEVKTNEEYQAAMKENDVQKNEKGVLEEQVIKFITEVEEQRKQVKELDQNFKTYEAAVNSDKQKLEKERAYAMNLIREQEEARTHVMSQLDREIASLYHRISTRTRGPIVAVENGMCLGCNMKIRPQLYNEVIGYKVLHRCPSCGRILITCQKETPSDRAESELIAK